MDPKREDRIKEQFPTITELKAAAVILRENNMPVADLLDKAAKELSLSIDANLELFEQLMKSELKNMMRDFIRTNQSPRVVGISKDVYLAFCRTALRDVIPERKKELYDAVKKATKGLGAKVVADLEDGEMVVKHIRDVTALIPGWAQELAEFSEKNGG